ncbi:glycoside hydrolase family 97 catalytic domain-containing protein [Formosa sp. A9]|uniref:glycoside hydrolase family 97 protein n=1 Tax=Formosa sp. A9 TaxID=3442641 RepID=UPI003EBDB7D1
MKKLTFLLFGLFVLNACKEPPTINHNLTNAENTISVHVNVNANNQPFYQVYYNNTMVLDSSALGIIREDANFYDNLKITAISEPKLITDTYSLFHGKQKDITYTAQQYTVHLENETGEQLEIDFNLSEDGVAFQYHFPETSTDIKHITEEKTSYNFTKNSRAWLQPMSKAKTGWSNTNPSYEEHYKMNIPVSESSPIGEGWVYPALFNSNAIWTLISETGLDNTYCGTRLKYNPQSEALQVTFPQKEEIFPNGALNPESKLPWSTPWRIITMGNLNTITESTLGTDLAKPAINTDTSFIKGGLASWSWVLLKDDFITYETTKRFIDYSASMHWPYCLIDVDWDTKIGDEKIKELATYAQSKDVKLLVWYNSSGSWNTTPYTPKSKLLTKDSRAHEFKKLNDLGVAGVKIDFFGGDGQSMIAYYHDILQDAAKHNLLVNFHGCTLPRGWQRTYPNLMTMEAIMGEEFVTFVQDNADAQPSHCAMLPFTRNVFDPMDFTPMVLDTIPNIKRVTTPAFELALPVLFTSGVQHIAEIPEGMKKQPEFVISYLQDIPTLWDASKFVSGYPGKDVVMARKKGKNWFVVGINGEAETKTLNLDLSFIEASNGLLITDGPDGLEQQQIDLNTNKTLNITVKPYGGFTLKF